MTPAVLDEYSYTMESVDDLVIFRINVDSALDVTIQDISSEIVGSEYLLYVDGATYVVHHITYSHNPSHLTIIATLIS